MATTTKVLSDCLCITCVEVEFVTIVGKLGLDARFVAWASTALAANDDDEEVRA